MAFDHRLPAWGLHFRRLEHCVVVFRPGLEVPVEKRVNPIPVPGDRDLAVVAGHYLWHTSEVVQGVVVNPDSVPDVAFDHAFAVEVITV